jgi:hypothetical protein
MPERELDLLLHWSASPQLLSSVFRSVSPSALLWRWRPCRYSAGSNPALYALVANVLQQMRRWPVI